MILMNIIMFFLLFTIISLMYEIIVQWGYREQNTLWNNIIETTTKEVKSKKKRDAKTSKKLLIN